MRWFDVVMVLTEGSFPRHVKTPLFYIKVKWL